MRKNKKAQIQNAIGSLIPLVIGVGVSVLVLIFASSLGGNVWHTTEGNLDTMGATTDARTQQNFTTSVSLSYPMITGTVQLIANGSVTISGTSIDNNFNIDYDAGTMYVNNTGMNYSYYNITYGYYNYTVRNHIISANVNSFDALDKTSQYMPLIILAVVIGVVLLVILGAMNFGGAKFGGMGGGNAL